MDLVTIGRANITQAVMNAIAIIGLIGILFAAFRQTFWKAWTDWKLSQLEANNLILKKQQELTEEVHNLKAGQADLQTCIHAIPGHPEHSDKPSGAAGSSSSEGENNEPNKNDNNQND